MAEKEFAKILGKRIKSLRIKAGLIQEDLHDFELSIKNYQRIERGVSNPRAYTILKLCKAFKCTPNDIFKDFENFIKIGYPQEDE